MLAVRERERPAADVVDPFAEIERLRREMWSLFDQTAGEPGSQLALADLEEADDEFVLEVELPGVKKGDVDIELEGRRVIVTAERKERERVGRLRRRTRRAGELRHEVLLPTDIDEDGVRASLDSGVLTLRLPKAQSARRRRIPIG